MTKVSMSIEKGNTNIDCDDETPCSSQFYSPKGADSPNNNRFHRLLLSDSQCDQIRQRLWDTFDRSSNRSSNPVLSQIANHASRWPNTDAFVWIDGKARVSSRITYLRLYEEVIGISEKLTCSLRISPKDRVIL